MAWSCRLTSYNILADAYATKRLYPAIDPDLLSWQRRGPAIVHRLAQLEPDVLCLQEVQANHWPELQAAFAGLGWQGSYAQKGQARIDGCALLSRAHKALPVDVETLYFEDGEHGAESSGHLALIGTFQTPRGLLHIATTHLRWQAPATPPAAHIGYRQAVQLLERCAPLAHNSAGIVICGDLNVRPDSPVIQLFQDRGFTDAYGGAPQPTCNPNRRAARIDYIFASPNLAVVAEPIPELDDDTPMPSTTEPSDHLPLSVIFTY